MQYIILISIQHDVQSESSFQLTGVLESLKNVTSSLIKNLTVSEVFLISGFFFLPYAALSYRAPVKIQPQISLLLQSSKSPVPNNFHIQDTKVL